MADIRTGTQYVNWSVRIPAQYFSLEWAKDTYGTDWDTIGWPSVIKGHRLKSKKYKEEWGIDIHTWGVHYASAAWMK